MRMVGVAISIMDLQVSSALEFMSPLACMGVCVLHKHPECNYTVDWLEFDSPGLGFGRFTATRKGKAMESHHMGIPYAPGVLDSLYQLQ